MSHSYNSHHAHSSPLDSVAWNFEIIKKVRQSIDEIDPEVLLMTEGQHEAYYAAGATAALSEVYPGTEAPPMRLALPGYWGPKRWSDRVGDGRLGLSADKLPPSRVPVC